MGKTWHPTERRIHVVKRSWVESVEAIARHPKVKQALEGPDGFVLYEYHDADWQQAYAKAHLVSPPPGIPAVPREGEALRSAGAEQVSFMLGYELRNPTRRHYDRIVKVGLRSYLYVTHDRFRTATPNAFAGGVPPDAKLVLRGEFAPRSVESAAIGLLGTMGQWLQQCDRGEQLLPGDFVGEPGRAQIGFRVSVGDHRSASAGEKDFLLAEDIVALLAFMSLRRFSRLGVDEVSFAADGGES